MSASSWYAINSTDEAPHIMILSDGEFDSWVDSECTAYKQYPENEDGSSDYGKMQAIMLSYDDGPCRLLIRQSAMPTEERTNQSI